MPHGMCLLWQPWLLGLHIVSDATIAAAYLVIPAALIVFLNKRRDLRRQTRWVGALFSIFILSCASTHAMGIVVLWHPLYILEGVLKAITAVASVSTAIALWGLLPTALRLPSVEQLAASNALLKIEVGQRRAAEDHARALNDGLEQRIAARTTELSLINEELSREVSQRKQTEERLNTEQARLRSVLSFIPDAIVTINSVGTIETFSDNALRVFGYTAAQLQGRNIRMLMPAPQQQEHDGYLEAYRRTGERRMIGTGRVVMGMRADGSIFPMELSVAEGSTAPAKTFIGVIRDLTETRENERRLQDLQQEVMHTSRVGTMGGMAAAIAHEINQPLTAISSLLGGISQILHRNIITPETLAMLVDAVGRAKDQAERTGNIIKNLRTFLRRGKLNLEYGSVGRVVEEAISLAMAGTRSLGVKLDFKDVSRDTGAMMLHVQIQQVVLNLIRNALEAVALQERREIVVTVSSRFTARLLEVSVADSGPGVAPEMAKNLFQPFNTNKADGMGIGLSVSREIIEAHKGALSMRPNPAGGAIFWFTLPLVEQPATTHSPNHAGAPGANHD